MEDKRTAFAILICIMLIMTYSQYVLAPYQQRVTSQPAQQQTTSSQQQGTTAPNQKTQTSQTQETVQVATNNSSSHIPTPEEIEKAGFFTISTDLYEATITKLGGRLKSLKLKNYRIKEKEPALYDLVDVALQDALPFGVLNSGSDDKNVLYSATDPNIAGFSISRDQSFSLVLKGTSQEIGEITKTINFSGSNYLLSIDVSIPKNNPETPIFIEWSHKLINDKDLQRIDPQSFSILSAQSKIVKVMLKDVPENTHLEKGENKWVSFGDKYFTGILLAKDGNAITEIGHKDSVFYTRVGIKSRDANFKAYLGPKDLKVLANYDDRELHRVVDLGFFSFLAHPLLGLLRFFHSLLNNWGLAIILLTLTIKLAFLPLTRASFKSMQAMQDIQPEVKALRERVTDATKMNQELMALYKRRGINPMGGCLPILIQIPVFFGLYNALLNSIELRHAPFALWITDLSTPEHLKIVGIPIPLMILLMGASMIYQQWSQPTATMDPAQQRMMKFMPVIFTIMFIIFPMPSGLVLYWLVNNTISIVQTLYLRGNRKGNPLTATIIASIAWVGLGYILTIL